MPLKKSLSPGVSQTLATASNGHAQLLVDTPAAEDRAGEAQAIHRDRLGEVGLRGGVDRDRPPQVYDIHQAVTAKLGAKHWSADKVFDWARFPSRERMRFTRYYFRQFGLEQHVIVDIFARISSATTREIKFKQDAIRAENARRVEAKQPLIGYLPVLRGGFVPDDAFDAVKRGEVLDLIDRAAHKGALV